MHFRQRLWRVRLSILAGVSWCYRQCYWNCLTFYRALGDLTLISKNCLALKLVSIYICSMAEAASLTAEVDALRGKKSPGIDDCVTLLCLGLRLISYFSYTVKLRQCDLRRAMKICSLLTRCEVKEI